MRLIKFRRLHRSRWEIAFNEEHLRQKLDGDIAEIIMPAKPLFVRLWRRLFPLKGITAVTDGKWYEAKLS